MAEQETLRELAARSAMPVAAVSTDGAIAASIAAARAVWEAAR